MSPVLATGSDEVVADRPHLSFSRVNKYLLCPEQYRLYYLEGLRPRFPSASLVFGQIVHQALSHHFQERGDPVAFFSEHWAGMKPIALTYSQKESWEKLKTSGKGLLEKFVSEELPKLSQVEATEKPFSLDITSLDLPFVGVIDLIARLDGKRTVVDFKTSGKAYEEHEALMSDQLSAYALAEPDAEQAALCVLVKTKEPKIEWHVATRGSVQFTEYLEKIKLVVHEIDAGHFYKRPGMWCSWCDFLPVCLRDQDRVRQTLITVP